MRETIGSKFKLHRKYDMKIAEIFINSDRRATISSTFVHFLLKETTFSHQ
jgi:hypothetical protein